MNKKNIEGIVCETEINNNMKSRFKEIAEKTNALLKETDSVNKKARKAGK